jgi:tetratricopeptide (TPR) repeat protein
MTRSLPRHRYLDILRAALSTHQYRFARQAALDWLATYPGDLAMGLYYGRALLGEKRLKQAISIFQGVRRADPESLDAVEALVAADAEAGGTASNSAQTHRLALTGLNGDRGPLASWGKSLWLARQALAAGNLDLAGERIGEALREAENVPLVGVLHLRYLAANGSADVQTRQELALSYHQRWPDCIACMLWLAQWSLEIGEADYAVALLHQAVSRDISGQVVQREWGVDHPYRVLWPEKLALPFTLLIPAEVMAFLGWNRLQPGETTSVERPAAQEPESDPQPVDDAQPAGDLPDQPQPKQDETAAFAPIPGLEWALVDSEAENLALEEITEVQASAISEPIAAAKESTSSFGGEPIASTAAAAAVCRSVATPSNGQNRNGSKAQPPTDPDLNGIVQEYDRLARRMKMPAMSQQDDRYPVYVIFSVRSRLEAVYGMRIADLLVSEMQALSETITGRKGWSARLFMPDDPALISPFGLSPLKSIDPWELKLALVDLDAALYQRGERIGAVLIVGGPEIVPFHHLPNPVDDQDDDVPTDAPYTTRDENYFIPEWPLGRLPGGVGDDPRVILDSLCRFRLMHEALQKTLPWYKRLALWLGLYLSVQARPVNKAALGDCERPQLVRYRRRSGKRVKALGYSAAVWKQAASLVFRPIGKPASLSISPPFGFDGSTMDVSDVKDAEAGGKIPSLRGQLAYFNLHGLVDAAEWYGQRDPATGGADPDYPVALRPKDILLSGKDTHHEAPEVVFSEACYGLHIQGREMDEAISLSFLQAGALAVIGSTCMAYGSIGAPLVAADLLGQSFWRYIQEGFCAGEALSQAKIHLASAMGQSQGYLDGEDQKTLISFNLYGDPLAQPVSSNRVPKSIRYQSGPLKEVHTVCERTTESEVATPLPAEVIASVRRVVAHHLPGMVDARLTFVHPRSVCTGEGHQCPTSQLDQSGCPEESQPPKAVNNRSAGQAKRRNLWHKSKSLSEDCRSLVILDKQVTSPDGVHPRVARLTLDERGKLVKLVVSR